MQHYVQYHNTDKVGIGAPNPRIEGFQVWSSKSEKELSNSIGKTVWLVSGEKQNRTKRYFLEYAFIVSEVVSGTLEGFASKAIGSQGHLFNPRISADVLPWFNELRMERNNFGYGFGKIKSVELIKEMEAIRDDLGMRVGIKLATS
jgi:hypothetical protein